MHFLIVKLSSIGDVVHTLPAVAALRRQFPDSRITWVVERGSQTVLSGNATIDEIVTIDTRRWRKNLLQGAVWREAMTAVGRLRGQPIDVAFDFQGLIKSGAITALSGARRRLGFSNDGLREEASRFFLTHQIVIERRSHVIDKNIQLVASLGVARQKVYEFPIFVAPEDEKMMEMALARHELVKFAIINPGGGWPTKLWPTDRYAAIADLLWERYNLASVVTYGPGEEPLAEAVVQGSRTGRAFMIASTLKQFVALARKAALFVGGDTGPLHIAAACRTPIVGIYGPTEPERNGPFDPLDICVGLEVECRPNCYRRRCPSIECMEIPVDMVAAAIERRLVQTKLWQLKRSNDISLAGASR